MTLTLPIIAIVGRPNVGKSTLFNCLTRRRDALVAEISGLTHDRQYGYGAVSDKKYIVIDTGGLIGNTHTHRFHEMVTVIIAPMRWHVSQ